MTDEELLEAYQFVRMLAWSQQVGQLADEQAQALVTMLLTVQKELQQQIKNQIEQYGEANEWTKDMENDVTSLLSGTLAGTASSATSAITEAAVAVAVSSINTYNSILSVENKASNVRLFEGLTSDQIKQFFVEQPLGGKLLSEWVDESFSENVQKAILQAIRDGVAAGEGVRDIVNRVLRVADIGFIRTRREITTLVRTYLQSANIGAQEAVFKRNEDVIKGYRRKETLDNRTCRQCALADGLIYDKEEKRPSLPAHPGCRGLYLPVTKSFKELGLNIEEFEEVARPWVIREDGAIGVGGKKIISQGTIKGTFQDWFKTLSPSDKAKTSIGPLRTDLLQNGIVQWNDMIDKNTGKVKTLEELGFDKTGKHKQ